MKFAAIDLGTNTFHLIIAEQYGDTLEIIYKTNKPIKLGEDITKNNEIIPAAFERGVTCLKGFKATLNEYGVGLVKAVATSGVRSAINGQHFIDTVKDETGIEIDIINGDKEAELIYQGVKLSGAIAGTSLIMDIGGGSTEFILCNEEEIIWKKSYDIGASRLMQKFFQSDPLSKADKDAIVNHLEDELKALKIIINEFKPETLIGSAGAFETFAEMTNLDFSASPSAAISLNDYHALAALLLKSTHKERVEMKGLIPLRVDMIVMAAIQTTYILNQFDFKRLKLSTYDLKMGVLEDLKN